MALTRLLLSVVVCGRWAADGSFDLTTCCGTEHVVVQQQGGKTKNSSGGGDTVMTIRGVVLKRRQDGDDA